MTSVQNQEDLEARIARIKKRNEEIEQKYREAEEDRLRAMKENAMVEIRPPKDDDWPREHKYDKVDFNYDLDPEALAQLEEKKKEKNAFIQKIAKDYKVFAEGEGPPPDPAYSFLADVERDGDKALAVSPGQPSNIPNAAMGNSNGARSPPTRADHFDRRNPHNRSGQRQGGHVNGGGPGGGGRGRGSSGKSHHGHHHPSVQRSYSTNEHDGWRSASGEQQRKNQGFHKGTVAAPEGGGGLWRREPYVADGPEKGTANDDASTQSAAAKPEPNLTVSISRDGEFKSVKVTTPPIIGSGRVGPRHPPKPQFQFHAGPGETQHNHSRQGGGPQQNHLLLTAGRKQSESTDHFNRNTTARKSDRGAAGDQPTRKATGGPKGASAGTHKNGTSSSGSGTVSVQDRLNRNRQLGGSDKNDNHLKPSGGTPAPVSGAAKATFKAISKIIEKNAAIDEQLLRDNEKLPSKVKELRLPHPTAAEQ